MVPNNYSFGGELLPLCSALPRRPERGVTRRMNTPVPSAWLAVTVECCDVPRDIAWNVWQGAASSTWSEVVVLRQKLLLWQTLPEHGDIHEVGRRGVTPQEVIRVIELLVFDSRVSVKEATILEECILNHVSPNGAWW